MYGLIFSYNPTTQQVSLVSGSPVYKNSVAVHTLTLQADLVLGNIVTATFYLSGQAVTQGLTMGKTLNEPEWTLPLPDLVTQTSGTYTVAFAILQPVVTAGATSYRVLTTANQTFTVITSVAQQVVDTVTPTEAENLQSQIDALDETLDAEQARLTALVEGIAPFIGPNGNWYTYDIDTQSMVDSGTAAQGIQGIQGETGSAATITVGTTTMGAAGSSASVENSGTSGAAVFDFTIPQGIQGIQGEKGDTSTITVGTTTTGNAGTDAQVTDTGTATDAIFNFIIPRGDTGASMRYKGTYSPSTAYVNNTEYIDVVSSGGTTYICVQSSTGQPVSDGAYWAVLALKGADGESFSISYVFTSIAAMNAAYDQFDIGDFVLINTGSVEDPDTGKLYVKGATQWDYLTDLSGVQGIQGVGIASIAKTSTSGLVDTYTITLTDGTTTTFTVTNGQNGTGAGNVIATNVNVADVVYVFRGATIDDNGNITGQLVTLAEGGIQTVLTFDTTPTANSANPVTSGGIKTALNTKQDTLTFDTTPTTGSVNPVTSGGVKTALNTKQDTLSFDSVPTDGSSNPVTSNGVYDGLATKQAKNLNFSDTVIAINGFVADTTYTDYPFRATVPLIGVTASTVANVVLSLADAVGGKIAPICETIDGGIYLYSTEANASAITIPTIVVEVV